MVKILLYRDWLNLKKHAISLLLVFAMFPMLLHLFISIPLSNVISLDIRYLNWAAPGIWVTSSGLLAFCIAILRMKKIKHDSGQLDALLKTPLANSEIVISVIISATILGCIQVLVSIALTVLFNNEYLGVKQVSFIFFQLLPLVNFFAILGNLMGIFVKDGMTLVSMVLFIFLVLTLSIGSFMPLAHFPVNYVDIVSTFPLTMIVKNCQLIIANTSSTSTYIGPFLTYLINIFLMLITVAVSHKVFRK